MKETTLFVIIAFIALTISGCTEKTPPRGIVKYKLVKNKVSDKLTEQLIIDTIKSNNQPLLNFSFDIEVTDKSLFDRFAYSFDSLKYTVASLTFKDSQGNILQCDPAVLNPWNISNEDSSIMVFNYNLQTEKKEERILNKKKFVIHDRIQIPLMVFHALSNGQNKISCEIELNNRIYMRLENSNNQYIDSLVHEYENLYKKTIEFNLDIPKIYSSKLYLKELKIADEYFSNYDVKIFGSGKPDLLWELSYDVSIPGMYYNQIYTSTWYKNTQHCIFEDSVKIYYYSTNDKLIFNFYDHDVLNKNDFIDSWACSVNELISDTLINITDIQKLEFMKLKLSEPFLEN
ncbi:MAG: hypothetical protein C0594_08975 [Marinilabiliales bacterium]|nr:MAG: hypothetical protein C0594_08975 [Marinilabiliales bacterium]